MGQGMVAWAVCSPVSVCGCCLLSLLPVSQTDVAFLSPPHTAHRGFHFWHFHSMRFMFMFHIS